MKKLKKELDFNADEWIELIEKYFNDECDRIRIGCVVWFTFIDDKSIKARYKGEKTSRNYEDFKKLDDKYLSRWHLKDAVMCSHSNIENVYSDFIKNVKESENGFES